MMLDFLHQRQALGAGVIFDRQVHQQVLGDRVVDEIRDLLGIELQVLRLGLAAIDGRGHAAGGAEFLDFTAAHLRTLIGL
jgi:hypothetical protein